MELAGSTGFEPAVSALTGQRVKPGYTTTPKSELNYIKLRPE